MADNFNDIGNGNNGNGIVTTPSPITSTNSIQGFLIAAITATLLFIYGPGINAFFYITIL